MEPEAPGVGVQVFVARSQINVPAEELFAWHVRPGAFERLTPPFDPARIVEQQGTVHEGDRLTLETRLGPFWRKWIAEHHDFIEGRQFRDIQVKGPFALWDHTHRMFSEGPHASTLEDTIRYAPPLGNLGRLLAGDIVRRRIEKVFGYRHRITSGDLKAHQSAGGTKPMRILVSGSRGLVGAALVPFLTTGGHEVVRLVRETSRDAKSEIIWDPHGGRVDAVKLEGFDAVVHLAGESIATGRWTAAKKERILKSRSEGTRLLAEALGKLSRPPKVFACASAIGFYGEGKDELLPEGAPSGDNFLAEVCRQWEAAAEKAENGGLRVVNLRFGAILSPAGGALAKMLTPFRMGVGGIIGSGQQWFSWIGIDDAISAILHCLKLDTVRGPVNIVSPEPVTNEEFTKTLGRVLGRPTILPMPAFAARAVFGQMADELLLASARVEPEKLRATGYEFRYPKLEDVLRHMLGKM